VYFKFLLYFDGGKTVVEFLHQAYNFKLIEFANSVNICTVKDILQPRAASALFRRRTLVSQQHYSSQTWLIWDQQQCVLGHTAQQFWMNYLDVMYRYLHCTHYSQPAYLCIATPTRQHSAFYQPTAASSPIVLYQEAFSYLAPTIGNNW